MLYGDNCPIGCSHLCPLACIMNTWVAIRDDSGNGVIPGAPGKLPVMPASEISSVGHIGDLALCTRFSPVIEIECRFSCAM